MAEKIVKLLDDIKLTPEVMSELMEAGLIEALGKVLGNCGCTNNCRTT